MSLIKKPAPLRTYHDAQKGIWFVEVDSPLPPGALRPISAYMFRVNHDRWLSMRHGDERERLGKALQELKEGKIQQVVKKKSFEIGFD